LREPKDEGRREREGGATVLGLRDEGNTEDEEEREGGGTVHGLGNEGEGGAREDEGKRGTEGAQRDRARCRARDKTEAEGKTQEGGGRARPHAFANRSCRGAGWWGAVRRASGCLRHVLRQQSGSGSSIGGSPRPRQLQ
jgi:hypothetical protein